MMRVPYSKEKKQYINETSAGLGENGKEAGQQFPPSHYVLKADMMAKMGYPLPDRLADGKLQVPEGFVITQTSSTGRGDSHHPRLEFDFLGSLISTPPRSFVYIRNMWARAFEFLNSRGCLIAKTGNCHFGYRDFLLCQTASSLCQKTKITAFSEPSSKSLNLSACRWQHRGQPRCAAGPGL